MSKFIREFVIDEKHLIQEDDDKYTYYIQAHDCKGNPHWKFAFYQEKSSSGGFLLDLFLKNLKSTEMKG